MDHEKVIAKIILPKWGLSQEQWKKARDKALRDYQRMCWYHENPNPEIVLHPLRNLLRFRNMRLRTNEDGCLLEQLFVYFADGWKESPSAVILHWLCEIDLIKGFFSDARPMELGEYLEMREKERRLW